MFSLYINVILFVAFSLSLLDIDYFVMGHPSGTLHFLASTYENVWFENTLEMMTVEVFQQ